MINIDETVLRQNFFKYLNSVVESNNIIKVSTKKGNAIIISEYEYNSLVETLCLSSNYETKEKIIKGLKTPISECVTDDNVKY